MGITPGQEEGFQIYPGPGTGDLVIDTPDGRRIVTQYGNGYERLQREREIAALKTKFDGAYRRRSI